jgi:hypothetical protein
MCQNFEVAERKHGLEVAHVRGHLSAALAAGGGYA